MSQDNVQLVPYEGITDLAEPLSSPQLPAKSSKPELTPGQKINAMLRGRYGLAFSLAIIFGCLFGAGGFFAATPKYQATGYILFTPDQKAVLQEIDTPRTNTFQLYVKNQENLVMSEYVAEQAFINSISTPRWQELKRNNDTDTRIDFREAITALNPPRTEMVLVTFEDEDAEAASIAVNQILAFYKKYKDDKRKETERNRISILEGRRSALQTEREGIEKRIADMAKEYGTDDLSVEYKGELEKRRQLDLQIKQLKLHVESLRQQAAQQLQNKTKQKNTDTKSSIDNLLPNGNLVNPNIDTPNAPGDNKPNELIAPTLEDLDLAEALFKIRNEQPEEIMQTDAKMKSLIDARDQTDNLIISQRATLGENHRFVRQLRSKQKKLEDEIRDYLAQYRARKEKQFMQQHARVLSLDDQIKQLEAQLATIEKDFVEADKRVKIIGNDLRKIEKEKVNLKDTVRRFDQIRERHNAINTERDANSSFDIINAPQPIKPAKDRRIQFAALGGFAGIFMGFGFVMFIGFLDRRMYGVEDAQWTVGSMNVLGILPSLPDNLADPEQAAIAAHCVHKIRTLLQIGGKNNDRGVFSVTSPTVGDGKTSLALAMGLSFANSGHRTLLVDCDLAGRGLTHRINTIIRRKIGQILLREGLVTEEQLDQALSTAHSMQIRLGEALVDLGYVNEQAMSEALSIQEHSKVGLLDALEGEPIDGCVAGTGINNLDILPAGSARAHDLSKLSPTSIRRVLDDGRSLYDVIIVDTGPVPESLDAALVAAEVDGVIMTFSRGSDRRHAERAITYLDSIGANLCGVVFNRAEERDWVDLRAGSRAGVPGTSADLDLRAYTVPDSEEANRFGPIARAVASSTAAKNYEQTENE